MKKTLLLLSFILCSLTISAQEKTKNKTEEKTHSQIECDTSHLETKTICNAENSKVSYYEALIDRNAFNIYLINSNYSTKKDNKKILLDQEEEDQILYANW